MTEPFRITLLRRRYKLYQLMRYAPVIRQRPVMAYELRLPRGPLSVNPSL